MKARKSIRSLYAFLRQVGRRVSPSTLLFQSIGREIIFLWVGLCFMFYPQVWAQDQPSDPKKKEEKRLDLLFDRIMQTLPNEARSKVDSAATMKSLHQRLPEKIKTVGEDKKKIEESTRLRELPPELKEQVERALADMKERSLERKAQFIESRHGKK